MKRRWVMGVAVSCALLVELLPHVCSAASLAEEQTAEPLDTQPAKPPSARRWYGLQTFAADGVAGGLFLGAVAADHNSALFGFSALSFGLGAPVIHVAHGNWDVALASVGLRVFCTFAGALIGGASDEQAKDDAAGGQDSSSKWTLVGVGIGGLVASAADGLLLAYDTRVSSPAPPRNQLLRAESYPQLLLLRHGIALGYSGQF